MSSKKDTKKKKSAKDIAKTNSLISNTIDITTSSDGAYDGYRYLGIDKELVKKNIFIGNKCLTLDYGYRYEGIINSLSKDGECIYVDFGDKQIAISNFENVSNQKMNINDLAYLVCEKGDYYDINAGFVPPF